MTEVVQPFASAPPWAYDFDAIIALGSNIGDKRANIAEAVRRLTAPNEAQSDIHFVARSRDFRTPPWGNTDQDWFVNACLTVRTALPPHDLLARCLDVERQMGRLRAERWGPRVIDLDLLLWRDIQLFDEVLVLPHPRMTERAFVLAPLADVAGRLELGGRTVEDWLAAIDRTGIEPIE